MITGEEIAREARSWLGTRFRWHGRVKINKNFVGGVDCLGLIIGVGDSVGYLYNGNPVNFYDIQYCSDSDFRFIKCYFSKFYIKKEVFEPSNGDIILQRISGNQYHLGIYNEGNIIHASLINRKVVENRFDGKLDFDVFGYF